MTQDNKNMAEQSTERNSQGSADQAVGKQPAGFKAPASNLAAEIGEIEKELAHVSATLQK